MDFNALLARLFANEGDPEFQAYARDPQARPDVNAVEARFRMGGAIPPTRRGRVMLPPPAPAPRQQRQGGPPGLLFGGAPAPSWGDVAGGARDLAGQIAAYPARAMGLPGAGYQRPGPPPPRQFEMPPGGLDRPTNYAPPQRGESVTSMSLDPFVQAAAERQALRMSAAGVESGVGSGMADAPQGGSLPPASAEYETDPAYRASRGSLNYQARYASRPANSYGGHVRTSGITFDPIPEPPQSARRPVQSTEPDLDAEWRAAMERANRNRARR